MDEDLDLSGPIGISVMMSESISRLATAHSQSTDDAMKEIITIATRICLQNMMPPPPDKAAIFGIDGGKMQ
jgi:hypothetical protein